MQESKVAKPAETKAPKKEVVAPKKQVVTQPIRRTRDSLTFVHDLYKLKPAFFKRNTSYRRYAPKLEEVEHAHFYHSHSRRGIAQDRSVKIGGHFHEIEPYMDAEGEMQAKCGPPLREEVYVKRGKQRKRIIPVQFEDESGLKTIITKDEHTHVVEYKWSEDISEANTMARQKKDSEKISQMLQGQPVHIERGKPAPEPMPGVAGL